MLNEYRDTCETRTLLSEGNLSDLDILKKNTWTTDFVSFDLKGQLLYTDKTAVQVSWFHYFDRQCLYSMN